MALVIRSIIIYIILLHSTAALGQDPVCRVLNKQNGLPSNTVYAVLQDTRGFMWFAHERGLSRYDGTRFVTYKANMFRGFSLSNLMQGSNGDLWVQDFSGHYYHTKADSLIEVANFITPGVYSMASIVGGNYLVSVKYDSLKVMRLKSRQCFSMALPNKYNAGVYTDSTGLYFISSNIVYKFNGYNLTEYMVLDKPLNGVFFLIKTTRGFVAFTKQGTPQAYILEQGTTRPFNIINSPVFIQEVSKVGQEIWVSTTSGSYCFKENLQPLFAGHCFFKGTSISSITKDREGSYWFCSLDKGLIMVPNINTRLYNYEGESITTLAIKDEQSILIGTNAHRLLSFDQQTKKFKSLFKAPNNHQILYIFHNKKEQHSFLCSDRLVFLNNFKLKNQYLSAAKNVTPLAKNWYCYAFASGIGFFDISGNKILPAGLKFLQLATMLKGRSRWVHYLADDTTLLAATSEGLYYFKPNGNGAYYYNGKPVFASGMYQHKGEVLFTTFNQGVLVLNKQKKIIPLLPIHVKDRIYKLQTNGEDIWMMTDEAIIRFNNKSRKLQRFTVADGLPTAEYKDILWHNGSLFLATTQGLAIIDDGFFTFNYTAPLLVLNEVQVNGLPVNFTNIPSLKYNENNFRIAFSVLAYKNINEQRVRYRINKNEWQNLEAGVRMLYLPALASGKYQLQLEAFNEDSIESKQPILLHFQINAPFYQQTWFIFLCLLLLLSGIFYYYKSRLRIIQKRNAIRTNQMMLEQELQRSKLASIKSQMNPHFFFNALNTIQSYIYSNDKLQAAYYLNQFSDLTRMVLEMSNKDFISLSEEITALRLYLELEALRFEGKLHYEVTLDAALKPDQHWLPPMLVQPYLENAIKHGLLHSKTPWKLSVFFKQGKNGLIVIVDDNGIGRKKSNQINANKYRYHEPFAMSANEKRLEILNRSFSDIISVKITDKFDKLGMAEGTIVELNVPTKNNFRQNK